MQNGARFGGNKGKFSDYAKAKSSIFSFFTLISGISPSIYFRRMR
ncbi:hypothetical protein NBRC111894_3188 [Sporolactobacillus inulinus]|uniref:Uncharacterized protein n=1 Tax=Sporolactobacillus inulinus TaxID=2078 RepID=A0A4Y1ZFB0_9BACL|nr:hypothetical protein NBRC111894_3188 [Sporolactobacillus inulinus]